MLYEYVLLCGCIVFFLMIRRPPRSTLFPYTTALPILTVAALSDCIRAAGGKLLRSVELFDIYRGKGIASGSKSAAFRLTLRADDRTLTDADSDGVVSAVLAALEKELNAKLR